MQRIFEISHQNIQYQYQTLNKAILVQSFKDISKYKEVSIYEPKNINEIMEANLEQAYFMHLSLNNKLKLYTQQDLFISVQGQIVYLFNKSVSHQKLAKIMKEVNSQNFLINIQKLIKKIWQKLKIAHINYYTLFEEWSLLIEKKRSQFSSLQMVNKEVYKNWKYLQIFQNFLLRPRIQGSILVNKFQQLTGHQGFHIRAQIIKFIEISQEVYFTLLQKQKQKSIKIQQLFLNLTKLTFFSDFKAKEADKINQYQDHQNNQLWTYNIEFILILQIFNSQLQQIKNSLLIEKKKMPFQSGVEQKQFQLTKKQKINLSINFMTHYQILVKFQTNWKMDETFFETQFNKKYKDILQEVNYLFLSDCEYKIPELTNIDVERDNHTQKIYITKIVVVNLTQANIFDILKAIDQLTVLYLALVKLSLYYQIMSFDVIQRYRLRAPTSDEQSSLIRNLHGYMGILYQKYESLKRSCLQQNSVTKIKH